MKKKIVFGVLALALMIINVAQSFQIRRNGISFRQLINLASANDGEQNEGTYTCETSVWAEVYDTCSNGFDSYCQYTDISCWESPHGLFDEDISCSIIVCSDCHTGMQDVVYNDCSS